MVIVSAGLWHMLHVPDPQDFVGQEAAFAQGAALFAAQELVRAGLSCLCPLFRLRLQIAFLLSNCIF